MTQDEIIRMAREAGFEELYGWKDDGSCEVSYELFVSDLERFAALVAAHELSAVYDEFYMSLQSDLEYGIKSTNERMVEAFKKNYPALNKFCLWLNERMGEYEGDEE